MKTRHGPLACAWKLDGDRFTATLTIPPNTTAEVVLPVNGPITENGQPLAGRPGVISCEGNRAMLGSGTYQLEAPRS
jgi:alpha-L-rhamnosidase